MICLNENSIAEVIISSPIWSLDKFFQYKIPEKLKGKIKIGMKVSVPFGMGNKKTEAYVIDIVSTAKVKRIKNIYAIMKDSMVLSDKMIDMLFWIKNKYVCTYYEALKVLLPPPSSDKTIRLVSLSISKDEAIEYIEKIKSNATAQKRVLEILLESDKISAKDLISFAETSYATLKPLLNKGIITYYEERVYRNFLDKENIKRTKPLKPTSEQKKVIKTIMDEFENDKPQGMVLRGITGSGKTEIFLQVIEHVISDGKQAIVLVPEISLTPLMVKRYVGRFGSKIAVLHSGLSLGERYDEWEKIMNSEVDVVVGARSAIFAPFDKLGIIIVDEEHEGTYKSELAPKYHAREVAEYRAAKEKAMLILSSATPSLESCYGAKTGKYLLAEMDKRYNDIQLPKTTIVDMRKELASGNRTIFSNKLKTEINKNLEQGQQTILFMNRRGFSTFVSCRNCGYVAKCPNCSISLTYHLNKDKLNCHYCGYTIDNLNVCPECDSMYIRYFGTGTQKVEAEIRDVFPSATAIRMDMDTTGTKHSHKKILNKFSKEKIDILIGTQMVSKGLDFPNVTLVGVLAADTSLNYDDFRSSERTFQLITQVCGRAGRGTIEGRAVVQTYQPENYAIQLARMHDYKTFYKEEIQIREKLIYPPFCNIAMFMATGEDEKEVIDVIKKIIYNLKQSIKENGIKGKVIVYLVPTVSPIQRIKNKFRWRFFVKYIDNEDMRIIMCELLRDYYKNNNSISLTVDINPTSMY